jgi:uncharacterized membrane protein YhaH (DUF805 family)
MDFNKILQNFVDQVTGHYMDFNGRIGRAQFWYFILACVVVSVAAAIVDIIIGTIIGRTLVSALVGLALLLPIGGMAARRVQDVGQNGQLVWVWVASSALGSLLRLYQGMFPPTVVVSWNTSGISYSGGYNSYGGLQMLIGLVALVASIAIIYFGAQPGQSGDNQYGPPPPVWTPNA